MDEVLDEISPPKNKTSKILKDFIPVFLAIPFFGWTVYLILAKSLVFEIQEFVGYFALLAGVITYFINRKAYIIIVLVTFIMGFFGVLFWTPYHNITTITFIISISFNQLSSLFLFVFLLLFYKEVNLILRSSKQEVQEQKDKETNKYKVKFKDKSLKELKSILNSKGYRKEVIVAVKQLIAEKSKTLDIE